MLHLLSRIRLRGLSQRRVMEDRVDSRSPDPSHPVMFRGSPSPLTSFYRRPAPSPEYRAHRLWTPSPMVKSSVDPDEFSSTEGEDGVSTEVTATPSEEVDDGQRVEEDGELISSSVSDLRLILVEESIMAGSSSSISGSPPLSPAAAVRFYLDAIDAGG
ncbi:hypothetical protein Dimus_024694 [Dionaea muscipula]